MCRYVGMTGRLTTRGTGRSTRAGARERFRLANNAGS